MCEENCDFIDLIAKQFLSGFPVKDITWKENLTWDEQELLMRKTVYFETNLAHPLRISYQKTFVKKIIDHCGKHNIEVHDTVFEAYGELVSKQESDYCFRHFLVPPERVFTFQENVNIISQGTTGLSAWQGGVALAEWCLQNRNQLKGKTILELGSGVGLTGLIALLTCHPKKILLTDCHESVLLNLRRNVELNLEKNAITRAVINEKTFTDVYLSENIKLNDGESSVEVVRLPWEVITEELILRASPEFILAADVVYDNTLFEPLVKAFKCFLETVDCKVVLACTERNEETLNEFLNLLRINCNFSELPEPQQNTLCWTTETAIRFFVITKK